MAHTMSRILAIASSVVLLSDLPGLWRSGTVRRGRKAFTFQLSLVICFLLGKRFGGSDKVWPRLTRICPGLQALFDKLEEPPAALAAGLIVPAFLASAAAPFVLGRPDLRARRWLLRVLIFGSVPVLADAIEERFGEEVDSIAVLALELGLLMREDGAASVILLMLTGGEALEHYAFARAKGDLSDVFNDEPPLVRVQAGQSKADLFAEAVETPAQEVRRGDVLVFRPGEVVAVDGQVLKQPTSINEALVSGEAAGTPKAVGEAVLSGSVALQPLWLSATAPYAESTLELMRLALKDALDRKGEMMKRSAQAAELLKPITLAVAALGILVRRSRGISASRRWSVALSVFMAATPCPALIGVPVAFLSGMSLAARRGVLVKSSAAMEAMARATHIILDKTGTLTWGLPEVQSFDAKGLDAEEALQLVACAERLSTHPLAQAICRYAKQSGVDNKWPVEDSEHTYGAGVTCRIQGRRIVVGSQALLLEKGVPNEVLSLVLPASSNGAASKSTSLEVYFAIDTAIVGRILLEDQVRPGTREAISRMREMGLKVSILSGDRSGHLKFVAEQVGICAADTRGGCLPQEKARLVQELKDEGAVVVMVGDEGNDATALAHADVGICVGVSGLASQSADVVVSALASSGHLERIVAFAALCRHVVSTAQRGVVGGLCLSALQVVAAGTGNIPPRTNAVMQELVDLSATINAVSVLGYRWM